MRFLKEVEQEFENSQLDKNNAYYKGYKEDPFEFFLYSMAMLNPVFYQSYLHKIPPEFRVYGKDKALWPSVSKKEIFNLLHSKGKGENSILLDISPEEEITSLKNGKIPWEVLYEGIWGELLTKIDEDYSHIYTRTVNAGIINMLLYYRQRDTIKEKLLSMKDIDERIDLGTGNGEVSHRVAEVFARDVLGKNGINDKEYQLPHKIKFICCDLSKKSLEYSQERMEDPYMKMSQNFSQEYFPWKIENLLQQTKKKGNKRLISMFNVVANLEEAELKSLLKNIYNNMQEWDTLLASFFQDTLNSSFSIPKNADEQGINKQRLENKLEEKYHFSKLPFPHKLEISTKDNRITARVMIPVGFKREFFDEKYFETIPKKENSLEGYFDRKIFGKYTGETMPNFEECFPTPETVDKKHGRDLLKTIEDFQLKEEYDQFILDTISSEQKRSDQLKLYDNPETKRRIVFSFLRRYGIPDKYYSKIKCNVEWKNDGRVYQEISIDIPKDITLSIPNASQLSSNEFPQSTHDPEYVTLLWFKSYRMTKEYIQKLCEEIWFGIEEWLQSEDKLQIMPILKK